MLWVIKSVPAILLSENKENSGIIIPTPMLPEIPFINPSVRMKINPFLYEVMKSAVRLKRYIIFLTVYNKDVTKFPSFIA